MKTSIAVTTVASQHFARFPILTLSS